MMLAIITAVARAALIGMSLLLMAVLTNASPRILAGVIALALGISLGAAIWTGIMYRAKQRPPPAP